MRWNRDVLLIEEGRKDFCNVFRTQLEELGVANDRLEEHEVDGGVGVTSYLRAASSKHEFSERREGELREVDRVVGFSFRSS